MQQGFVPKKPIKQIEQNFRDQSIGTSVGQFIAQNFKLDTGIPDTFEPAKTPIQQVTNSKNLEFMNDNGTGNGRITLGVKSLEAICKTLKGVNAGSLVLFDQVIYSNPYDFRHETIEQTRLTIATNLGIANMLTAAASVSSSIIVKLNSMSDRMTQDIRNGTFTFAKWINEALVVVKGVVVAAMNYKSE